MMSSQLSFSEIFSELKKYNPHASESEISAGIIEILEKEILPRVLQQMSLTSFPSWRDVAIQESGRRIKKRFRPKESLEERRRIIQQVEYVKRELHWDGGTLPLPILSFPDADNIIGPPESDMPSAKQLIEHDEKEIETFNERDDPYGRKLSPSREKYQIVLSKEFQEKILSDALFEEVFRKIEVSIRKLINVRNFETNVDVSFRPDLETPSWKKCVITIGLPPQVRFEDRTRIWTIFDLTIRNQIGELAKKGDSDVKEFLYNLNKKLFVHIEL